MLSVVERSIFQNSHHLHDDHPWLQRVTYRDQHKMALEQTLFLDSAIRDWVLVPILVVMILVGVLRHNVISLLNSAPKSVSAPALREQ